MKVNRFLNQDLREMRRRTVGEARASRVVLANWELTRGLSQTRNLLSYQDVSSLGTSFSGWAVSGTGFSISSSGVLTADITLGAATTVFRLEITVMVDGVEHEIFQPVSYHLLRSATLTVHIGHTDTINLAADAMVMMLGTSFSGWTVAEQDFSISSSGVLTASPGTGNPATLGSVTVQVTVDGNTGTFSVPLQWDAIHEVATDTFEVIRGLTRQFGLLAEANIAALGSTFTSWDMTDVDGFSIDSGGDITADLPFVYPSPPSSLAVTCRVDGTPAEITVGVDARDSFIADLVTDVSSDAVLAHADVNCSYDGTARDLYDASIRDADGNEITNVTVSSDSTGYADMAEFESAITPSNAWYGVLTRWYNQLETDETKHLDAIIEPQNSLREALIAYKDGEGLLYYYGPAPNRYAVRGRYVLSTLTDGNVNVNCNGTKYRTATSTREMGQSPSGVVFRLRDLATTLQHATECGDENTFPGIRKLGSNWRNNTSIGPQAIVNIDNPVDDEWMTLFATRIWRYPFAGTEEPVTNGWRTSMRHNSIESNHSQQTNVNATGSHGGTGFSIRVEQALVAGVTMLVSPETRSRQEALPALQHTLAENAAAYLINQSRSY